jgi:NADH:ubiquinone oxidoreductase subunit E
MIMDIITVCMGSSCFSRGNSLNAELVRNFIKEHHLENKVKVKGCLCRGLCKNGPNIEINGKNYNKVSQKTLERIITEALGLNK